MATYAVKRKNETVDKLINRFKKQTQGCRLVLRVRAKRYFTKLETQRQVRLSALKRSANRAKNRGISYAA